MTTTLQIEEGKFYRRYDGSVHGPAEYRDRNFRFPWRVGSSVYTADGRYYFDIPHHELDLVAEAPNPAIEDDGFVTVAANPGVKSALAGQVSPAEAMQDLAATDIVQRANLSELAASLGLKDPLGVDPVDIKTVIADEAKRIVSGARRSAYGTPESNFERISAMWTAYAKAKGWPIEFTAGDVSPMMILMKIARVVESPAHYDSWVDIAGYCLTGAEVNGVSKPA